MSTITLSVSLAALIALAILLFIYEKSKPTARDIVPVVIISVIASLGRILCVFLPSIQPVTAIVIIMGICFNKRTGFITGCLVALISNLYIGHGPWTPWQMLAWGVSGILASVISSFVSDKAKQNSKAFFIFMTGFAFVSAFIFSTITDIWTISTLGDSMPVYGPLGVFIMGWLSNIPHAIGNALFFIVLYIPFCKKLLRLKNKYGVLEYRPEKF